MSKKKTSGVRPKVELLIIAVFFLSFIVWAMSKCNASSVLAELNEQIEEGELDSVNTAENGSTDPYGTPLPPAATTANTGNTAAVGNNSPTPNTCLLYTSDAADE